MNLDHIFVSLAVTDTNPKKGSIVGLVIIRTDRKGAVRAAYSSSINSSVTFAQAVDRAKELVFDVRFPSNYLIVANNSSEIREFIKHAESDTSPHVSLFDSGAKWLDIVDFAWPMAYNDIIPAGFDGLCSYFRVETTGKLATDDCQALCEVYWAMMRRYRTLLTADEVVREVGGSALENVRSFLGF